MKKPKGSRKAITVYDFGNDEIAIKVREKCLSDLPAYTMALMGFMVNSFIANGNDPLEVMKMCKTIVEAAWENNGIHVESVESANNADDRKDRMGL